MNLNASVDGSQSVYTEQYNAMTRVLTNVAELQQAMMSQFNTLSSQLEGLRGEVRGSLQPIVAAINRLEGSSEKTRDSHDKEIERMMRLLETLALKGPATGGAGSSNAQTQQQQQATSAANLQQQQLQHQQNLMQQYYASMLGGMGTAAAQMQAQAQAQAQAAAIAAARAGSMNAAGLQGYGGMSLTGSGNASSAIGASMQAPVSAAIAPQASIAAQAAPSFASPAAASSVAPSASITGSTTASPAKPIFSFGQTSSPSVVQKPAISIAPQATPTAATKPPIVTASPFSGGIFSKAAEATTPATSQLAKPSITAPAVGAGDEEDDHGHPEEYEPDADFKPVVPLPELVDVVTGEEGENTLFESRCKVYRFTNKEWKERGTGVLKILENPDTKKARLVMRREQVHKVCVNHYIDATMKIEFMKGKTKALYWLCMDASDGEPEPTQLSVKFAEEETASKFKKVFEGCIAKAVSSPSKAAKAEVKAEAEEDEDSESESDTSTDSAKEVVIPKNEPVVKEEKKTGAFDWKKPEGSWDCPDCYTNNKADSSKCACCGTGKDGKAAEPELPKSTFAPSTKPGTFSFGIPSSTPAASSETAPAKPAFSFGQSQSATPATGAAPSATATAAAAPKFSFGQGATKEDKPAASASPFSFSSTAKALEAAASSSTPTSSVTPTSGAKLSFADAAKAAAKEESVKATVAPVTFSFGKTAAGAAASPATTTAVASPFATASTFSFKTGSPKPLFGGSASPAPAAGSVFGGKSGSNTPSVTGEEDKKDEEPAKVFGQGTSVFGGGSTAASSFSFSPAAPKGNIFEGADAQKAKDAFSQLKKAQPLGAKKSDKDEDGEERGADEEYEPDVDFKPVVPLPDLVEVTTGEEGEEVLLSQRCKLYRYDRNTKETKERGTGDIKILKHPDTGVQRVVMRREQVHKLCANFRFAKNMKLMPKPNQATVFSFFCQDFSEDPNGVGETYFVKFKNEEFANNFKKVFEAAVASLE